MRVITTLISVPSALFYCFVIITMIRKRHLPSLRSPHSHLVIALSITDVSLFGFNGFISPIPGVAWFEKFCCNAPCPFHDQLKYIWLWLEYFRFFIIFLLSVHTFSAVVLPYVHKKVWSRYFTIKLLFGVFLLTSPIVYMFLPLPETFERFRSHVPNGLVLNSTSMYWYGIVNGVVASISFLAIIVSVVVFIFRSETLPQKYRVQKRIFIPSIIMITVSFLYFGEMFAVFLTLFTNSSKLFEKIHAYYPMIADLRCVLDFFAIVIFDENLRLLLLKTICRKKITVSVMVVPMQNVGSPSTQ